MAQFKGQLTTQTLQTAEKITLVTVAAWVALVVEYIVVHTALNALRPSEAKKLAAKQAKEIEELSNKKVLIQKQVKEMEKQINQAEQKQPATQNKEENALNKIAHLRGAISVNEERIRGIEKTITDITKKQRELYTEQILSKVQETQKEKMNQQPSGKGYPSDNNDTIAKLITGLTGLFGFGYAVKHKDEIVKTLGVEKGNSDNDDSLLE